MASRRRKPGPFSRDQALMDVDRRTRAGRVMKTVIMELTAHVGDASAAQRLLIQAAALKATRLALLLAWMNAMRQPAAIGLREYLKSQTEAATAEASAA